MVQARSVVLKMAKVEVLGFGAPGRRKGGEGRGRGSPSSREWKGGEGRGRGPPSSREEGAPRTGLPPAPRP